MKQRLSRQKKRVLAGHVGQLLRGETQHYLHKHRVDHIPAHIRGAGKLGAQYKTHTHTSHHGRRTVPDDAKPEPKDKETLYSTYIVPPHKREELFWTGNLAPGAGTSKHHQTFTSSVHANRKHHENNSKQRQAHKLKRHNVGGEQHQHTRGKKYAWSGNNTSARNPKRKAHDQYGRHLPLSGRLIPTKQGQVHHPFVYGKGSFDHLF